MENRKRNVQIIVRVTDEERVLIEEKIKQIPQKENPNRLELHWELEQDNDKQTVERQRKSKTA